MCSASLWTKDITISEEQKRAIQQRKRKAVFTEERRKELRKSAVVNLVPYLEKYTTDGLIEKINGFYKNHGRIPLKREFNMYHEYKRRFGSWNKAVRLAGFDPNPELFSHKFKAIDGHRCDSFTEKIIDDWLYNQRIKHERNFKYGKTKMTADFLLRGKLF